MTEAISKTAALVELNARAQKIEACEAEYRTWGGPDPRGESAGPLMLQKARELREIAAAIAALPAVTVVVRPLVWVTDGIGRTVAHSMAGTYLVSKTGWGRMSDRNETPSDNPKAAAQADYTARILAALTTQPAPDNNQKGGDAHVRQLPTPSEHDTSPGVTAGATTADADAQAIREAALREAQERVKAAWVPGERMTLSEVLDLIGQKGGA